MTEISLLLAKINNDPAYLSEVDLAEETDWFDKKRMKEIIMGITSDEVCTIICEMLVDNWYFLCDVGIDYKLMDRDWEGDMSWRFNPVQETPHPDDSIDCFIQKVLTLRSDATMRKKRLAALKEKLNKQKKTMAWDDDEAGFLEREVRRMELELDTSNKKIASLENDYKALQKRYQKESAEWKKRASKVLQENEDVEKTIEQTKVEAVRELVKKIVIYAEGFPANENAKADTIKGMLLAKAFYEHIPNKAFDEDLRKRIDALGRKEMSINMTAKSMFEVTGNQNVVIGNGQNG